MADVRREENPSDVSSMGLKGCHWYQRGDVTVLDHAPDVDVALKEQKRGQLQNKEHLTGGRTELLPAHSKVPSVATVTLDTETSSSGTSW